MKESIKLIQEWAKAFGEPVNRRYTEDSDKSRLYVSLIEEELKELQDAKTDYEIKKELADLFWVVCMWGNVKGVEIANDDIKTLPKAAKESKGYTNNFILKRFPAIAEPLKDGIFTATTADFVLSELLWMLVVFAEINNIDLNHCTKCLYTSNMSKLCRTKAEARENQAEYWLGVHKYGKKKIITTKIEKVGKYYLIKNADGKIMKPKTFKKTVF